VFYTMYEPLALSVNVPLLLSMVKRAAV